MYYMLTMTSVKCIYRTHCAIVVFGVIMKLAVINDRSFIGVFWSRRASLLVIMHNSVDGLEDVSVLFSCFPCTRKSWLGEVVEIQ